MGQQLLRGGTAAHVDTEADAQERLELLAEFLRSLQPWSTVRGNEVQCLQWLFVEIRRLGFDHLDGHDAE